MVYEERICTIRPDCMAQSLRNCETMGLPVQIEVLKNLVGFRSTEVGGLNKVVRIWAYDGFDDRLGKREALARHPKWPACLDVDLALIEEEENRVLVPAPFSPLK